MDMGIKGKTAIVCASSRGLGKGCALALAAEGVDLIINGRDKETLSSTAKEIREKNDVIPIFFLTAKNLKEDVLKGFKIGADDYITKPFDSDVLLAKIKAILNRKITPLIEENENFEFEFSDFSFNSKLRHLKYNAEEPIKLSPKENQLLRLLVLYLNDLLPREIALNKIWRDDNYFTSRSMDVYIAKLRKYLSVDEKVQILNIHGEGFRLVINV